MMNEIVLEKEGIYRGALLLVNAEYPLRHSETKGLAPADARFPDIFMKRDAVNFLQLIFERIAAGSSIALVSGYRSFEEQSGIYEGSLKENGEEFTKKFVALPNHSEHQTGLAIDLALNSDGIDFICPEFPYDGICGEFRKKAPDCGYIERYPAGKEAVTGITHEPWHFRYVGFPHSAIMSDKGLTLEEYTEFIKGYDAEHRFVWQKCGMAGIEVFYVPAASDKTAVSLPKRCLYQISGNNADGFVVTVWRNGNEQK